METLLWRALAQADELFTLALASTVSAMRDQSDLPEQLDDADAIEHSPLERAVTRDGVTVDIFIYRGPRDAGWLLEIEDELGGSTVWDDLFDSDQAALDEALHTIDEDGIHSLTVPNNDPDSERALWRLTTAQPDIAELRRMLASSNGDGGFDRACGVFAAVATTPRSPDPSEWLALVQGDLVFEGLAEVQRFARGAMALYNEVLSSVADRGAHCCPAPDDHDAVREFCAGYVRIASLDPEWSQDDAAFAMLVPILALAGTIPREKMTKLAAALDEDPESWLSQAREELADTVTALHAHWHEARIAAAERLTRPHRRATPKVGRNERCPCGSGKKFKKCCAQ